MRNMMDNLIANSTFTVKCNAHTTLNSMINGSVGVMITPVGDDSMINILHACDSYQSILRTRDLQRRL